MIHGAKIGIKDRAVYLSFPYDKEIEEQVALLPGAKKIKNVWRLPLIASTIHDLEYLGFNLSTEIETDKQMEIVVSDKVDKATEGYYPFQKEGVAWILKKKANVILADEMGLGKTLQAIGFMKISKQIPCLIICPGAVKLGWERMIREWLSPTANIMLLYGRTPSLADRNKIKTKKIVIINYDIIKDWKDILIARGFKSVIFDECQQTGNPRAKRTVATKEVVRTIPYRLALSGTPITSCTAQFWPTIDLLSPGLFKNSHYFLHRYCGPKRGFTGKLEYKGATNTKELNTILKNTIMLRRKKDEVGIQLPPKQYTFLPIEIDNKVEYNKIKDSFLQQLAVNGIKAMRGAMLAKLRQAVANGKITNVKKWIDTFLESGEKLLVVGFHRNPLIQLNEFYGEQSVLINGSITGQKRQDAIDAFGNNEDTRLMFGNMGAMGTGVDGLQKSCSNILYIEFPFTPGEVDQVQDRLHRIGQTSKSLNIYYSYGKDTIESKLIKIVDKKRKIITGLLDGKDVDKLDLLTELYKLYQKEI